MFPRPYRLLKERDFKRVLNKGQFFFSKELTFKFLKNNLDLSRFGFIISNKVSKKATTRNRIKRQLREIIRLKLKEIRGGYDFLIIAKPEILKKTYSEMDKSLLTIFQKLNLFQK